MEKKEQRRPVCEQTVRSLHRKIRLRESTIKALKEHLSSMETKRQGVFTAEWLTRVALAAPTKSIRSLMRSSSDVAGIDHTIAGRTNIRHIRNAFCETYKSWLADHIASVCRQALLKGRGTAFVSFYVYGCARWCRHPDAQP